MEASHLLERGFLVHRLRLPGLHLYDELELGPDPEAKGSEGNEEGTKPAVGAAVGATSETLTGSSPSAEEGRTAGLGKDSTACEFGGLYDRLTGRGYASCLHTRHETSAAAL